VTSSIPSIHPEAHPLDDGSVEVGITVDDSIPLGPIKESLKVTTEHPSMPVVEVPVLGTILGDLEPFGRRLDFGFIKEGQPASVTFMLRRRGGPDVKILKAEAKLPIPVDVQVTPEGNDFKIVASLASAPAFSRLTGFVELTTDNPGQPLVKIPVYGGVLAAHPFELAAKDGNEAKFQQIVNDALARGDRIPVDRFYSDVLGGVRDQRAATVLLRALDTADLPARMRAVELLTEFNTPEVVERLRLAVTDDSEEFVRQNAVEAYAQLAGKIAVPTLLVALRDNDAWVRENAATALGKLGDPSAIPALRAALRDPDPEADAAVRNALTSLQGVK
jgi:hypothetical protein